MVLSSSWYGYRKSSLDNFLFRSSRKTVKKQIGYAKVTFELVLGVKVQQTYALINELRSAVILSLPFLRYVEARLDLKYGFMDTCFGRMGLITGDSLVGIVAIWDQINLMKINAIYSSNKDTNSTDSMLEFNRKLEESNLTRDQIKIVCDLLLQFHDL